MDGNETFDLINAEIKKADDSMIELNEAAMAYIFAVDEYNSNYLDDASYLKDRMKKAVMRAAPYDI